MSTTAPTLLRIDTSIRGTDSVSRRLTDLAVRTWLRTHPTGRVVVHDLAENPPPHFAGPSELAEEYATELRDADDLVLGMPLYNWGPPSMLKAWFDHVIASPLARDPQTMAPMLTLGTAVLVVARGGAYGDDTPRAGWDHATDWAQKSFTAVGLDLTVVPVEMTLAPGAPYLAEFEHLYHRDLARAQEELEQVWTRAALAGV
ncbi:FMN-dependent NADH-azoreductase [Klenkia sp. PcliD-1-E]|uniref:FMN-dependent NADH-azoreductase n=1 Tax=Klenkia sp. PcliD-1-E TaxID=2954492 RepID=UPI0020969584|nr:NAD(P)H-dependent oxidoreductase [Klenkia sp. PcliD-1-E]MCO7221118.1 NAD(P)H-dependent oxidoreductase [Klenkia sp. PcliD-1-E]